MMSACTDGMSTSLGQHSKTICNKLKKIAHHNLPHHPSLSMKHIAKRTGWQFPFFCNSENSVSIIGWLQFSEKVEFVISTSSTIGYFGSNNRHKLIVFDIQIGTIGYLKRIY